MICREITHNIGDSAPDVDWVEIDWPQTLRRALRLVSNAGERVDVLLPRGRRLRHGDVLGSVRNRLIVVFLRPCDVLAFQPTDLRTAATLALRLGNLHLSVEVREEAIYTPLDGPGMELAEDLKVTFSQQRRRFFPDVAV